MRKILAMKFQLESSDDGIIELIAWLDEHGQGKYLEATHPDKCLLDMRAGDVVTFKRKQTYTVKRLKPWRTSECKCETDYEEITCGRDWEATTNTAEAD